MLRPVAGALNAAVGPDTEVELTLTGEQGLSVFSYPASWAALLNSTKATSSRWAGGLRALGSGQGVRAGRGCQVFSYPASWAALLNSTKAISSGRDALVPRPLRSRGDPGS
jgi:hypothetical protein